MRILIHPYPELYSSDFKVALNEEDTLLAVMERAQDNHDMT